MIIIKNSFEIPFISSYCFCQSRDMFDKPLTLKIIFVPLLENECSLGLNDANTSQMLDLSLRIKRNGSFLQKQIITFIVKLSCVYHLGILNKTILEVYLAMLGRLAGKTRTWNREHSMMPRELGRL